MLTHDQKKSALNSVKTRLTNVLENWEQQQVSPVLNAQQQVLLSSERIKAILMRVLSDIGAMYDYLMRSDSDHDFASPIMKQIDDCLSGQGYKKTKPQQNLIAADLRTQVERSIAYKFADNDIIVNIFTNTKLANGEPNSQGFLGSGSYKTVKEAVRITINKHTLTTSFIAKSTMLLEPLKDNGHLSEIQRYNEYLSGVRREVSISRRYNSRYINEMELGPTFDSMVYFNKESLRKVSKTKIQYLPSKDVNQPSEPNPLPDDIISKKYKSIYVFSEKALGSMLQLPSLLTPQEKAVVLDDLINFRMPEVFYNLFNDALEALKVMHQRGDVHGDFKLENLLIYGDKLTAKLADFGATTLQEDNKTVRAANILGTHYFASPEITKYKNRDKDTPKKIQSLADLICANHKIADIEQNDPKHDMWSLGISLFCMLVNKDDNFTAKNCEMKQSLDFISRKHPILKELLAVDMDKRPSAERAQQLLRLDFLLTNNPLEYKDGDLELLEQHHLSLIAKGTYCGVFFKPRQDPTPHNSIRLVIDKIEAMKSQKTLAPPLSVHKTTSSVSLQTN